MDRTESFNGSWHKMATRICSFHFRWRNPMTTTVYCDMPSWNMFDWLTRKNFNLMLARWRQSPVEHSALQGASQSEFWSIRITWNLIDFVETPFESGISGPIIFENTFFEHTLFIKMFLLDSLNVILHGQWSTFISIAITLFRI